MSADVAVRRARLLQPFATAAGEIKDVPLALARVETGWGEVSTLGLDPGLARQVALDVARHDHDARRAGQPVWQALGAPGPLAIEVNATIAAPDRASAAAQAAAAVEGGFRCVKVKVGLGDDAGRLAAVRAAGGEALRIRIDANGAWSVREALAMLRALEPVGIECCEEPCTGVAAVAAVASDTLVPIALDESAAASGALDERVCDAVCLKLGRCGGLTGLLAAAAKARALGYQVYLASLLDGPLGIAAALHAAAVIAPDRPCGLATLGLFAERPTLPALTPTGGRLSPPPGAGLGDGLLGWYGPALR